MNVVNEYLTTELENLDIPAIDWTISSMYSKIDMVQISVESCYRVIDTIRVWTRVSYNESGIPKIIIKDISSLMIQDDEFHSYLHASLLVIISIVYPNQCKF